MMSEQSMGLVESSRFVSDDRLSNASSVQSRQSYGGHKDSPVVPPRRKHKSKKQFFHKPFMRKSISNDSQLSQGSTERLPTIVDEKETLHKSHERLSRSKWSLHKSSESVNSSGLTVGAESTRPHITVVTVGDVKPLNDENIAPKPTHPVKRKTSKKVMRTSSFGALKKPSGGLVAIAKDIEKRFKQKRRSKTADFSTILREPGETSSLGGGGGGGGGGNQDISQDESDIKDDIY